MAQQPLFVVESEEKANMLAQLAGGDAVCALISTPPVRVEALSSPNGTPGKQEAHYSFILNPTEEHLATLLEKHGERPVYLAMDGDSRGRYWVWLLQNYIRDHYPSANCKVLALRGLTPYEFSSALKEADKDNSASTDSIHIRAVCYNRLREHLQRLIGTCNGPNKLPLNFNSLTTLFLMKNREDEVRMYSPLLQWHAEIQLNVPGQELWAAYKGRAGESATDLESEEHCQALEKESLTAGVTVVSIVKKKLSFPPPAPYLLAELLQETHTVHQLSPKTVLQSLRRLFHGVVCGDASKGLISWYIPGNGALSDDTLDRIDDHVVERFGENGLSGKLPYVSDGAILALWPEITAADLQQVLSPPEKLLYEMIRLRTLASRMPAAVGQSIVGNLKCGNYVFEVADQQIEEKGHLAAGEHEAQKPQLGESPLSQLTERQVIEVARVRCEHTSPYPPEQYSFETLFSDLSDFAIPVDDNLILMLQSMLDAGYIALDEHGFLKPLPHCLKVVDVLNRVFPSMQGINLSAYLEQTAEEVISGRKTLGSALNQVDQVLSFQGKPLGTPSVSSATLSTLQKKRKARVSSSVIKTTAPLLDKGAAVGDAKPEVHPSSAEEKAPPQHGGEGVAVEGFGAGEETESENISPPAFAEEPAASEQRPAPQEGEEFTPAAHDAGEPALGVLAASSQKTVDEASQAPQPAAIADSPAEGTATDLSKEPGIFSDQGPAPDENASGGEPIPPLPTAVALDEEEKEKSRPCPVCGRPMAVRRDQFGQFFTCTGFPACRYAEPENSEALEQMPCPVCAKGKVRVKTTPTGKMLYVCSEIDCEFMAWAKPHPISCPSCGSLFLVEKRLPSGVVELRCPRAGCTFRQSLSSAGQKTEDVRPEEEPPGLPKKVKVRKVAGSAAPGAKKRVVRVVRRRK